MGDWRRVQVEGTCGADDVERLRLLLGVSFETDEWDCLCSGGICGLPNFGGMERFSVIGNLCERDYDEHGVAEHLTALLKECPSLSCKIHVGSSHEEPECVATVVACNGKVLIRPADIKEVPDIDGDQMQDAMLSMLMGK